jgi:hypothetical protein
MSCTPMVYPMVESFGFESVHELNTEGSMCSKYINIYFLIILI